MAGEFAITDEILREVLEFAKDERLAPGIHTYPTADAGNKLIHLACLELEKRGDLIRKIDEAEHCFFVASDQGNEE